MTDATPRDDTAGNDWRLLLRLGPYVRPDRAKFIVAVLVTPFTALLALVQPYLVKRAIDDHIVAGQLEGLDSVAFAFLAAVIGWFVLELLAAVL